MTSRIVTIPNILTLARLIAVPVFLGASVRGEFMFAFVLFVLAAFTDIVDGFIARRLNQRSKLGALFDPAADKTMMVCGYLFFTFSSTPRYQIPVWLTSSILVRDFFILVFAYLFYTRVHVKRFPPSWAGKASTLLQAITLAWFIGANAFQFVTGFEDILLRVTVFVTLFSGWDYLRRGDRLLLEQQFHAA
jgi:cardiolipin synthase